MLRKAGLVTNRKEGTSVYYSLSDPLVRDLLAVAKQLLISMLGQSQELLADLKSPGTAGRRSTRPKRS